jgi:small subunit ribosomal protein S7
MLAKKNFLKTFTKNTLKLRINIALLNRKKNKFYFKTLTNKLNSSNLKKIKFFKFVWLLKKFLLAFLLHYKLKLNNINNNIFLIKKYKKVLVFLKRLRKIKNDIFIYKKLYFFLVKYPIKIDSVNKTFIIFLLKNFKKLKNTKKKIIIKSLLLTYFKKTKLISYFIKKKKFFNNFIKKKKFFNNLNVKKLYLSILGSLIKNGKKVKAAKILQNALSLTSIKLGLPLNLILRIIYNKLKLSVEPKSLKIRGGTHILPVPVKEKRKFFLIAKTIICGIKKNKTSKSKEYKLFLELVKTIKTKNSASFKLKKYNVYRAIQNKSNAHFRW